MIWLFLRLYSTIPLCLVFINYIQSQVIYSNESLASITEAEVLDYKYFAVPSLNESDEASSRQIVFPEKGNFRRGGWRGGWRNNNGGGWGIPERGNGWEPDTGKGNRGGDREGWGTGGPKGGQGQGGHITPKYPGIGLGGGGGHDSHTPGNSQGSGNKDGGYGGSGVRGIGGPSLPPAPDTQTVTCDIGDKCHHFVHCSTYSALYLKSRDRCCYLSKQAKGMCCSATYPQQGNAEHLGTHFKPYSIKVVTVYQLTDDALIDAAKRGYAYKTEYKSIEVRILELGLIVEKGTPAYGHLLFFQTTAAILDLARDNYLVVKATYHLQETYYLTNSEAGIGLQNYNFKDTVLGDTCPITPKCHKRRYRTADGSCNNENIPKLGQSTTPLLRLLPPDYADGIWSPRARRDGSPLPSARLISRSLVRDINNPDPRYSHLLMQFGQFIDHDLSHVPIFRLNDMSGIQCCGAEPEYTHPMCFPIQIPPHDPVFKGESCMNFVRSAITPRLECTFGHADQLNQLTHWLDGSQIYGNSDDQLGNLREFSGGLLRVTRSQAGRHLLPLDLVDEDDCEKPQGNSGLHCFVAGDHRVNEQIGLTSHHTIWLREHNRIAVELSSVVPGLDDETLFQETRRIVVAEYQHIVYNEWLPIIIGREFMEVFGILPLYEGYGGGYDPALEPTIANAFTTAAFRLHTLVSGWLDLNDGNDVTSSRLTLHEYFNNPHLLREPGFVDSITKGFLTQPVQRFDPYITTELRDRLFQNGNRFGMDLVALNIQRGRDHGLPGYNEYRDLCRLGKARDFGDLAPLIPAHKLAHLEDVYESVDDIDLFIGGIHEIPHPGALVGPTFLCIIGDQFARLKKSDRFFYDIGGQGHSFSKSQLHEIRKVSMARILCDNTDEIRFVQPLAFHLPNGGFNPKLPCASPSIPRLDLSYWAR